MERLTISVRDSVFTCTGAVMAVLIYAGMTMIHNAKIPLSYQDAGITAAWIPPTVRHYDSLINEMSKKYDIDANLIAILMTMESGGNAKAKSEAGAIGLMQVTPPTAKEIAAKDLKVPATTYDVYNPKTNVEFAAAYLAWLRSEFGTVQQGPSYNATVELIAAGYNGGPGASNALEQGHGLSDTQTVVYSRDAFNMWRERVAQRSPTYERWKERGGQTLLDAAAKSQ